MRTVQILDATLRDGGCVNDFNFGSQYMHRILDGLNQSGVEYIELGYIDAKNGSSDGERTKWSSEKAIEQHLLTNKLPGRRYMAMIDYGKYDPDLLAPRTETSIDGIRLAFHKTDRHEAIAWGRKIIDKGYLLFLQPMQCPSYSDVELIEFVHEVNEKLPDLTAYYVVDSFGEMRSVDVNRFVSLVDHNLAPQIALGFHAHNNLQLAYSNSMALLTFPTDRNLVIDATINGMGKGAGNTPHELLAEHMNLYNGKQYDIHPLLEVIDKVINQIKQDYEWGYAIEFYLSSANHCTPTYASHFYRKHMLTVGQVSKLLGRIREDKRVSFDKNYADELYYEFNARDYDDSATVEMLKAATDGKTILLIAPGKSILDYKDRIDAFASRNDVLTIALNNDTALHEDFILITKQSSYDEFKDSQSQLLITSNVTVNEKRGKIVNYVKWTESGKADNALYIIMNLLRTVGVTDVALAGFDGFSTDVDANYYDSKLNRPVNKEQAERRNKRAKDYLASLAGTVNVSFLTPSRYE